MSSSLFGHVLTSLSTFQSDTGCFSNNPFDSAVKDNSGGENRNELPNTRNEGLFTSTRGVSSTNMFSSNLSASAPISNSLFNFIIHLLDYLLFVLNLPSFQIHYILLHVIFV